MKAKFKAFDKRENKWCTEISLIQHKNGGIYIDYVKGDDFTHYTENNENVIVVESTGAEDKNGKEIYEGDYNHDGETVIWCEKCMGWQMAAVDIPNKETIISCHWCDGNFHINEDLENFEVIGNINE